MAKLKDAKLLCPELVVVHVATYKEGEKEPGYWDDVDTRTHKVRPPLLTEQRIMFT
jgi:DNA polymerase eta